MGFSGNIVVAQSGGPTAAINATLSGVIEAAMEKGINVYGARNGIKGVIEDNMVLLNPIFSDNENIKLLKCTPAAFLGSCRYRLPDMDEGRDVYEKIFDNLEKLDIKGIIYIGGNDSMDTVAKLSLYAEKFNKDLKVVGVPKTVDNDLAGTDHTPGFGSAAKFVAATVKCIARDSAVYTEKSMTIIEIMGRNAGWLTAASALARCHTSDAPHLIYLPEKTLPRQKLIDDVKNCPAQNMIIVISEGIKDENGNYYCEAKTSMNDIFGHAQLAGAANEVAKILKDHFKCKTRGIELNIPQRCASFFASLADIEESEEIGKKGAEAIMAGKTGIMMGFLRKDGYNIEIVENNVADIANIEKKVPDEFITKDGHDVTDQCIEYLRPLIMGETEVIFEEGLPKHIALDAFI